VNKNGDTCKSARWISGGDPQPTGISSNQLAFACVFAKKVVCFRHDNRPWGLSAKPLSEAHAARITQTTNIQCKSLQTTNRLGIGWHVLSNCARGPAAATLHQAACNCAMLLGKACPDCHCIVLYEERA
jgi:hypothetical protein